MYDNDYADEIVDQLCHDPYQLSPAEEEDFRWIALKASEIYGSDDALPLDVKLSWFRQNPTGFWVIKHNSGRNTGSCELLPLKKPVINKIIDGMIKERKVLPEDIYSPREIAQADCLYIENVMALREDNTPNQWAFKECLTEMPNVIKYCTSSAKMRQKCLQIRRRFQLRFQ